MKIDAHQHYWQIERGDYLWMDNNPALDTIRRDFTPGDLNPHLQAAGIDRTVVVQAAATVAETEYLLELATQTPSIAKVVGWIDFESPQSSKDLNRLAQHPAFSGVRPMIQDIADVNWMLREDIQWAFNAIVEQDLTFDALGVPIHMEAFAVLFARYPTLRIVIDHAMKPAIRDREFDGWAKNMAILAQYPNVYCKVSGLLTEARSDDAAPELQVYMLKLVELFGAKRLMWGSDWPVLNLASNYSAWHSLCESVLPTDDHAQIFGLTAQEFYRITA